MAPQQGGTFQRIQFGPPRTLFALRVSEEDDGDRSCMYRVVLADDPSQPPEVEVTMDFAGWLTTFWRAEDRTTFLGTVEGEVFVLGSEGGQEFALESGGISRFFARSVTEVYLVTTSGGVFRWDGNEWTSVGPFTRVGQRPGSVCGLYGIGELADGRLIAVGERGTVLVQNGASWQTIEAPSKTTLTAVGTMQGATYVGGEGGACYRVASDLTLLPVTGPTYSTFDFADYRGRGYSASQAAGLMVLKGEGSDELEAFAHPLQPHGIAVQGDLLAVHGEADLAVFDGTSWHDLDLDAG